MNKTEKIEWLKTHFFADFIFTRKRAFDELSEKQSMFCVCGRLATGLHMRRCAKFNKKVDNETVQRLSYLLPKGGGL